MGSSNSPDPKDDDARAAHVETEEAALSSELVSAGSQHLQRRLGGKEVQLIALGGAIGTCMSFPTVFL